MRKLWRFLLTLAVLCGIAIGVARAFAIRWWRVPDNDPYLEASIAPSLRGGDWILLWRLSPPHPGDLVLCPEPKHPERIVIGRIAALEGERVDVNGTSVSVNGRRMQDEGGCDQERFTTIDPETHRPSEQRCRTEELSTRQHERGETTEFPPQPVGMSLDRGQVFLLSDNRQFPYDSRDFGPVERETCTETVFFRLVSKLGFKDVASRLSLVR